jgi:hypothetical protein
MIMSRNQKNNSSKESLPAADTGNASSPSPHKGAREPVGNQLFNEKAETYLREAGNIEDLPDAQDQQQMDEAIQKKNNE